MAVVALEGMRFFAHHGVYEQERKDGNYFEVDVTADFGDVLLADTDKLEDVLNYGEMYDIVAAVMAQPKNLLETVVNGIGRQLMRSFPQVPLFTVRVSKENPPVAGFCKRSYVEGTFFADDNPFH
jgi:7,8-dihydroneopterin aldolase/epimerase/oxygenase